LPDVAATEATVSSRSDVKRNRERLVSAARELFASAGVDVSVREVARHAGVGVGTLYRHFPAREDLVDAVLEDAFEEFAAAAEAALVEADAWRGFTGFIEQALVLLARNRGLKDVVETRRHGRERAAAMRRRIRPLIARLVARAQEQGALRADFTAQDIPLVLWASDRVTELGGGVAPEIWRRQLGFVFDGLRRSAATPLPQPPLTEAQLRRVGAARRKAS
jgi:AcrR family transcriptional regulator